jgi:flagellar biosynthesis chaperone FliJ
MTEDHIIEQLNIICREASQLSNDAEDSSCSCLSNNSSGMLAEYIRELSAIVRELHGRIVMLEKDIDHAE